MREIKEIIKKLSRKNRIKLAVFCARLVLPIWEDRYPENLVCRKAIEAAERCIDDDSEYNRMAAYAAAGYANFYAVVYASTTAAGYAIAGYVAAAADDDDVVASAIFVVSSKQGNEKKILEYAKKLLKEQEGCL